jgi:hypothetical protein
VIVDTGKVLGELGLMHVTYALSLGGWDVLRKINEKGFDLVAERGGKRKWIEVKSRDLVNSKGKNTRYATVGQSPRQQELADYLAVYLYGPGVCLMLPSNLPALADAQSRNSISTGLWDGGNFTVKPEFAQYANNFDLR